MALSTGVAIACQRCRTLFALATLAALLLLCSCVHIPADVRAELDPPRDGQPNNFALNDAAKAEVEAYIRNRRKRTEE